MKVYFIKNRFPKSKYMTLGIGTSDIKPRDLFFLDKASAFRYMKNKFNPNNKSLCLYIVSWHGDRALKFLFDYIIYSNKIQPLDSQRNYF